MEDTTSQRRLWGFIVVRSNVSHLREVMEGRSQSYQRGRGPAYRMLQLHKEGHIQAILFTHHDVSTSMLRSKDNVWNQQSKITCSPWILFGLSWLLSARQVGVF